MGLMRLWLIGVGGGRTAPQAAAQSKAASERSIRLASSPLRFAQSATWSSPILPTLK